jgi:hypothetical protein
MRQANPFYPLVVIPPWAFTDFKLSAPARVLFGLVYGFDGNRMPCTLTNRQIANTLDSNERTVSSSISELKASNLISVEYEGNKRFITFRRLYENNTI